MPHERLRLEALYRYQILDTQPDDALDRVTRITCHTLNVPVALISLIDVGRLWLKSRSGTGLQEVPRDSAPCTLTIASREALCLPDLMADPQWAADPFVRSGGRAYAGAPLITPDGYAIGALAVYDTRARTFTDQELHLLGDLAQVVMDQLELQWALSRVRSDQASSDRLAHHDALTGLPNRLLLLNHADLALQRAQRHGRRVALMMLDLDRFKLINDSHGHAVGDALLQAVAVRLADTVRGSDTVARFGGDEFVVLLPDLAETLDAAQVAQHLLAAFDAPFPAGNHLLHVRTSLGISVYPDDGQDAASLLLAADTAMYHAKTSGRGRADFYTPEMNEQAQHKLRLHDELCRAVMNGGLNLHYQPLTHLQTGQIIGVEALVRWPQAEQEWIPPNVFLPLAEETGLILSLGAWVLHEACTQLMRWKAAGSPDWDLSVNISVREWTHPAFLDTVRHTLHATGCPPERLVLDITERALMGDPESSAQLTLQLAELGVRVALDNFGSGYSSLRQLQNLAVSLLKVDRSFVCDLPSSGKPNLLALTVLTVGQQLGIPVIAEGIETPAQRDALLALRCEFGQGYLFSGPLSADELHVRYLPRSS
ncbi:MAG: diguanylate cyclase/phosphodiesterase with sensor [Deinococcus sp.]|nr:diguanylate cyclase/phosphodiesterase with sensor [Deinococcus sp.]